MKKILSLVLSCSLVLGSFGMAFAAPADVEGTKYEDSVTRLAALKVLKGYEDNTFKPEKTITRAEFAKIMANVTGVGTAAEYAKGQTKFADVAADHWAAGYINVVSDMGIITGYGDGNFGAQDQVTYAQAITMIVRALGYTPKADAMGGYPGGYLAVAAEKEITDNVNVVSTLAATRGDVAMLVDNALTVELMEQTTYGQYPEYSENPDKTLMTTKLDVDEIEGRVIAIPSIDSSLDDDEITISYEDKDSKMLTKTLTMKVDVEYLTLLGLEVKVWADGSDVFFMDVETDDKDIIFDTIDKSDADTISLLVDDESYDFDKDVEVYINYDEKKIKDIEAGNYGYVVLNKKDDVVAVNLFDFSTEGELVTKVDGEDITLEGTADLDLGDYDDGVNVFDKNFKTVDVDTIAENSVVNFYTDGDEAWIVAVNETATGTLDRASAKEIKVAGDDYSVRTDMVFSLDNNDDQDDYNADAEKIKDLMEEDVTVVLDINGDAKLITGDVKETSGVMFALFQKGDSGFDAKIKVINTAGDDVVYEFEKESDYVAGLNVNDLVAFELNKDGEIADGTFLHGAALDNGDYDIVTPVGCKINDDGYIELGGTRYYVEDDTIFFNVEAGDGEALVFDDIKDIDTEVDLVDTLYVIKADKGNDLVAVVLEGAGVASKATNYAIVVDEPEYDGDWKVTLKVAGEGEVEYAIGGTIGSRRDKYKEGNVLDFRLNTDNEITEESLHSTAVKVDEVNGKYFRFGTDWIKVADDRVMYLLESDGDLDKTLDYDDIEKNDKVYYVKDGDDKLAVVAVITDPKVDPEKPISSGEIVTFKAGTEATVEAGAALALNVEFNAPADRNIAIAGAKVTGTIVDKLGSSVVVTGLRTSEFTALKGKTISLGTVTNSLADAGTYTVIVVVEESATVKHEVELTITVSETKVDADAAKVVADKIIALGATPTKATIQALVIEYTALSNNAKVLVTNYATLEAFKDDIKAGVDLQATLSAAATNAEVKAARASYDLLGALGKAEVTVATITSAETALANAKTALANKIAEAKPVHTTEAATLASLTPVEVAAITAAESTEPAAYNGLVVVLGAAITTAESFDVEADAATAATIDAATAALNSKLTPVTGAKVAFDTLVTGVRP